ncbi:MAG: ABC transporter substrate-binding protein [Marinilabiliaceae bacterium]|nr:ABC transporter substrate-binding protein [Marinilabiliaceae bacterium]
MIRLFSLILFVVLFPSYGGMAQRIVSLVPSVTHTLIQIGAEENIVGRTSYCPEVPGALIVGDVISTNIESIISLQPDVVFTMSFTKQSAIEKLKSLGIHVVSMETPRSFNEMCEQTINIAQEIQRTDYAKKYVLREQLFVKDLEKKYLSQRNDFKAFFQIGSNPLFGVDINSYMDEYMSRLGLCNIIDSQNGQCSREFVVLSKPQYIFISDMGSTGMAQKEKAIWEKLLPQCRLIMVDSNKSCCPTPQFFRETLEYLFKAIEQ